MIGKQLSVRSISIPLIEIGPEVQGARTVLTLHNVGYQGLFPGKQFEKTGLPPSLFTPAGLEYYGMVNLLKGGIVLLIM